MSPKLASAAFVVLPLVACSVASGSDSERTESNLTQAADSTNPQTPTTPEPDTVHWVRDSSEYQAATRQAYGLATAVITAKASAHGGGTWGVIVDADETVLDNSEFEKEGWQQGVGYTPARWSAWVQRREAKAVPGAVAFTNKVHALGGKVVVITNRSAADCPATQDNLTALNFAFDLALCQTDVSDKNPRFQAVQAGTAAPGFDAVDVLMWLGDNILDFPAMSQSVLTAGDDAYGDFASRFIIIPNPMYGSWQGNPVR
jgi:5'-nucleotidase (lipoprotein e(P4) family)